MKNKNKITVGDAVLALVGWGYFIGFMSVIGILVLIVIGLAKLIFRF